MNPHTSKTSQYSAEAPKRVVRIVAALALVMTLAQSAIAGEQCKDGGGDPGPLPDNYCGCTSGSVYVLGGAALNARVAIEHQGQILTRTTVTDTQSGSNPIYALRAISVGATLGAVVVITAQIESQPPITRTVRLIPRSLYPIEEREQDLSFAFSIDPAPGENPPVLTSLAITPSIASLGAPTSIVTFTATATNGLNSDLRIITYDWQTNIDGPLGSTDRFELPVHVLSPGLHTVQVRAQDNLGRWSAWMTTTLDIKAPTLPTPTPTSTPTSTPTPSPTLTPMPTFTPTPSTKYVYLPAVLTSGSQHGDK